MILDIVKSIDGVPICLTEERWYDHIVLRHPYMSGYLNVVLETLENPQFILRGTNKAKIAVSNIGRRKWIHVIYREITKTDGFIISARIEPVYNKNKIIWTRDY